MGRRGRVELLWLLPLLWACELQETLVALPEDVVLAEVFLFVEGERGGGSAVALLHGTVGGRDPEPLTGAEVRLRGDVSGGGDAAYVRLLDEVGVEECLEPPFPPAFRGRCFRWEDVEGRLLRPGARVHLEVALAAGGRLEGVTTIPGGFQLLTPSAPACLLEADVLLPLVWKSADGTWAYVVEAQIGGLPEALAGEGIQVDTDPLKLLGLSISQADTSMVFPSELGLFDRFTEDRELLVRLQRGLPQGAWAELWLNAVDRNWANWIRGGNFNPSGQVRVPSVFGDGTGVFASGVVQRRVLATPGGEPGLPGWNEASSPSCQSPPGSSPPRER